MQTEFNSRLVGDNFDGKCLETNCKLLAKKLLLQREFIIRSRANDIVITIVMGETWGSIRLKSCLTS